MSPIRKSRGGQDAAPNAGLHGDTMSPIRKSRSGHEAAAA
jgi:hypothetical protein